MNHRGDNPTPDEIRERCRAEQALWTPQQENMRRAEVYRTRPIEITKARDPQTIRREAGW